MDDILVHGRDEKEHEERLQKVLWIQCRVDAQRQKVPPAPKAATWDTTLTKKASDLTPQK